MAEPFSERPRDDFESNSQPAPIRQEIWEILRSGYLQASENPATVEGANDWFKENADKYDTNKNGALEKSELEAGIKKTEPDLSKWKDNEYLKILKNGVELIGSSERDSDPIGEHSISKNDMNTFNNWLKAYGQDLERLKESSPGKYEAINFLRHNFTELDKNKDGKVSHDELRDFSKSGQRSDSQKLGAIALDSNFEQIAETTRISITKRYVDALLGKERPIGTREIAMFTTGYLAKEALRRGGGTGSPFADLISSRGPVYESIETLRLRPEEAKNRRIFWGKPQY